MGWGTIQPITLPYSLVVSSAPAYSVIGKKAFGHRLGDAGAGGRELLVGMTAVLGEPETDRQEERGDHSTLPSTNLSVTFWLLTLLYFLSYLSIYYLLIYCF